MSFDREGNDLKKLKQNYNVFIETGSEYGDGINAALLAGFNKIYSIELDEKFYNICKERFKDNDKVELILGNSLEKLPELLKKINEPFFLWLDAHWSCDGYKGEMMHEFLPKELDILKDYKDKFINSILLADDANHYLYNERFCENILNKIKKLNDSWGVGYYNSVTEGQVFFIGNKLNMV